MTNTLNRGGLKAPTELAVNLTIAVSQMWRHIVCDLDRKASFITSDYASKVFQTVVAKFVSNSHKYKNEICENGHMLVEELLPFMSKSMFNRSGSNLTKDTMSKIQNKSKRTGKGDSQERRKRETRKRQKLQSVTI